jgi:Tol biopolymer transport system component
LFGDTGSGSSLVGSDPFDFYLTPSRHVSGDGRFTVFASSAPNLVPGQDDANRTFDVFLYDRQLDSTRLVSRKAGTSQTAGNAGSGSMAISEDGQWITFASLATDLVAGMSAPSPGGQSNVFLFDRLTDTMTLVSHDAQSSLVGASYDARIPNVSKHGDFVTYAGSSVNLVAGFPNPGGGSKSQFSHAYLFERKTGTNLLLDHIASSNSSPGNGTAFAGNLTDDLRYITFTSKATNLLATPTTNQTNAYIRDLQTGETVLISRSATAPSGGNGRSGGVISADGKWVMVSSSATNLLPGQTGAAGQVFFYDVAAGTLSLATHTPGSATAGGDEISTFATMSPDGRFVAFLSGASDLVAGFADNNGDEYDVFLYDRTTDQTVLASHKATSANVSGNGASVGFLTLSSDGRYITYASLATDLISGFIDGNGTAGNGPFVGYDLFRYDRFSATNSLISSRFGSPVASANLQTFGGAVSTDGNVVAFSTAAGDIIPGLVDVNGEEDVFVRDMTSGAVSLASRRLGSLSLTPGGESAWAQQSADGRFITFTSTAANLVAGQVDVPNSQDVFLHDRQTKTTVLVSHAYNSAVTAATGEPNGYNSGIPVISADGRYIAFASNAQNLVPGFVDGNGPPVTGHGLATGTDVFLYDRLTGVNMLVSRAAGSTAKGGNGTSGRFSPNPDSLLSISDDGRHVAYRSLATNLVAGFVDLNGTNPNGSTGSDVFVFDRVTGVNEVVSRSADNPLAGGNDASYQPRISGDGRFVAYWSYASNLTPGVSWPANRNVYLYDRQTGTTALVSHAAGSLVAGNAGSNNPVISRDGRFVAFQSAANTLVAGSDTNGVNDVFLYDRLTGINTLVSHAWNSPTTAGSLASDLGIGDYSINDTFISADGRFVTYASQAGNLVQGFVDNNGQNLINGDSYPGDVYLFDRLTGVNTLVSRLPASPTAGSKEASFAAGLSGEGRFVAFRSWSTDLAPGVSASERDANYVFDRLTGQVTLVTPSATGVTIGNNMQSGIPSISRDGSTVVYTSDAYNLVPGDLNGFTDVFAYVTLPPRVQAVTIADGSAQRSVIRSLRVDFDQPVFFAGEPAAAFALTSPAGSVQLSAGSVSGNSVTLTFSGMQTQFGSLIDGKYTLRVRADQVSNIGPLDGNNDGVGGDDFTFNFHRLFGDADGNGFVDAWDFRAFRAALGSAAFVFDFDGDGDVDAADFVAFRGRFGVAV